MRSYRLGLLLAAATIAGLPAAVQAQEHRMRQGEPGDRQVERGDRPVGMGRERGPAAPAAAPPAPQLATPADPGRQARAAEYARRQAGQGQGFDGNWSRRGGGGQRNFEGAVPALQSPPASPQRYDGNRGFAGGDRSRFDDRRGDGNRFDDRRGDNHRYYQQGPAGRGFEDRGAWQRNWRNDRRYDWQDMRARNRGQFHAPRYVPPQGYGFGYRLFSPGFRLDPFFYGQSYWLDDPWAYRLPPAYGPYRWVRYYNDVLLVDITRGVVVDMIRDFFW